MWEVPPGPGARRGQGDCRLVRERASRPERSAPILGVWLGRLPLPHEPYLVVVASGREKRRLPVGPRHTSQNKTAGPTPCPLPAEPASAGASHRGFEACHFLVFFRFQNSPAFPSRDSATGLTGWPLPLASESVICKLDGVLKWPRELFIFTRLPSSYTMLCGLRRAGWLGLYVNT